MSLTTDIHLVLTLRMQGTASLIRRTSSWRLAQLNTGKILPIRMLHISVYTRNSVVCKIIKTFTLLTRQ